MATEQALSNGLGYASTTAANRVTALSHRRAIAAMLENTGGVTTAGLLSPGSPVAGSSSTMNYVISPFAAVLTRPTDIGAVIVTSPSTVTLNAPAADPTNPRIDRIYVYQPMEELSETGTAKIGLAVGTVAATPPVPSIPTGALEIARYCVNAGVTNTNGTFTNLAPNVSARVDSVPVAKLSGTLTTTQVPNLDASKIVSGVLSNDRIPSLDASKVTSGTLNSDRIPNLDASKIVSGQLSNDRIPYELVNKHIGSVHIAENYVWGDAEQLRIGAQSYIRSASDHVFDKGVQLSGIPTNSGGGRNGNVLVRTSGGWVQQTPYVSIDSSGGSALVHIGGELRTALLKTESDVVFQNLSYGGGTTLKVTGGGLLQRDSSSERFKEDIKPAVIDYDELLNIVVKNFTYDKEHGGDIDTGIIAEDMAKVPGLERLITRDEEGLINGFKYDRFAAVMLGLVQYLHTKQESKNAEIEERLAALEGK